MIGTKSRQISSLGETWAVLFYSHDTRALGIDRAINDSEKSIRDNRIPRAAIKSARDLTPKSDFPTILRYRRDRGHPRHSRKFPGKFLLPKVFFSFFRDVEDAAIFPGFVMDRGAESDHFS